MINLPAIDKQQLKIALAQIKDLKKTHGVRTNYICVLLVNGKTLFCQIIFSISGERIVLLWLDLSHPLTIIIPLSSIASVFLLPAESKKYLWSREKDLLPPPNLSSQFVHHTLDVASENKLKWFWLPYISLVPGATDIARYGPVTFNSYTPIYSDFEYFTNLRGGISGIGLSVPFAGVSIGWEKSLFKMLYEKVNKKSLEIVDLVEEKPNYGEVLCQGILNLEDEPPISTIEGKEWLIGLLSPSRFPKKLSPKAISHIPMIPVFVCKENFLLPYESFTRIFSNCVFYGEIYPASIQVAGNTYNRALKVRAIAYV